MLFYKILIEKCETVHVLTIHLIVRVIKKVLKRKLLLFWFKNSQFYIKWHMHNWVTFNIYNFLRCAVKMEPSVVVAQSAGAVEYTEYISAEE